MKIYYFGVVVLCSLLFTSCEKYEDYIKDYDFSAVYFGSQKPLRTVVAYPDMYFKTGVTLAGKRANDKEEWVKFKIDPSLLSDPELTNGETFTLLPASYYSLSDSSIIRIPKGKFLGDIRVNLNREVFTDDPLSLTKTYALPLRITETSVDSILSGQVDRDGNVLTSRKDYSIIVIKYISSLHGTYYHKGIEEKVDGSGNVLSGIKYSYPDLSANQTWRLDTRALNVVETPGLGSLTSRSFLIERGVDNSITLSTSPGSDVVMNGSNDSYYDPVKRTFFLQYSYVLNSENFNVRDTLILRRPPEEDLRFEEW